MFFLWQYNNELYHNGVKGMKWGVRRYQNSDGSLTLTGKRRFKQVSNDAKKSDLHTKNAKWLLKGNSENAKIYSKEMTENAKFSKEVGDYENYKVYMQSAKKFSQQSKIYNKMLKDIDNGTLKAGRDFIVTNNKHFGNVDDSIVFKKSDSEITRSRYKNKDDKTFRKTGIKVERDHQNRVTSLKATNVNRRQIKKINRMQKAINKKGDY